MSRALALPPPLLESLVFYSEFCFPYHDNPPSSSPDALSKLQVPIYQTTDRYTSPSRHIEDRYPSRPPSHAPSLVPSHLSIYLHNHNPQPIHTQPWLRLSPPSTARPSSTTSHQAPASRCATCPRSRPAPSRIPGSRCRPWIPSRGHPRHRHRTRRCTTAPPCRSCRACRRSRRLRRRRGLRN